MRTTIAGLLLLATLCLATAAPVKIEKGWLTLIVSTGDNQQEHKVEYSANLKETLSLTQSSTISIKAKVRHKIPR